MSALAIKRVSASRGRVNCEIDSCTRSGAYKVLILGWPVGFFCKKCCAGWREVFRV